MPLTPISNSSYYPVKEILPDRKLVKQAIGKEEEIVNLKTQMELIKEQIKINEEMIDLHEKNNADDKEIIKLEREQIETTKQMIANNNVITNICQKRLVALDKYIVEQQKDIKEKIAKIAQFDLELAKVEQEVRGMLEKVKLMNQVTPQNKIVREESFQQNNAPIDLVPQNVTRIEPVVAELMSEVTSLPQSAMGIYSSPHNSNALTARENIITDLNHAIQRYVFDFLNRSKLENTSFFKGWF